MKKYLIALAATTIIAAPALAANTDYGTATYGQDAMGWYKVSATGQTFCRFGTANTGVNGTNSTVDTNAFSGAGEGDGSFTFDIQNDANDTVQAAYGAYSLDNVVCNTPFTVTAQSDNGGLHSANTTSDTDFIQLVPYQVNFDFAGVNGTNVTVSQSAQQVMSSSEAKAGSAHLKLYVPAQNKLVLQGAYDDRLVLTMSPTV